MTDTSIRISSKNRKRLNLYRSQYDITQDEAIAKLLDEVDAPVLKNER